MVRLATWVVAAFVFSIPYENGVTLSSGNSLARALGLVAIAVTVVSAFSHGRVRLRRPGLFLAVAALFALFSVATYFWSINPVQTLTRAMTVVQLREAMQLENQRPIGVRA